MAVAVDVEPRPDLHDLQPLWHECAPCEVVDQCSLENPFGGWKAWQKHLAKRREPESPRFLKRKEAPLLWGWPRAWERDAIESLLRLKKRERSYELESRARRYFSQSEQSGQDLPTALHLIALAYALPSMSAHLSQERWWQLVEQLHELASEAQQQRVDWPSDPQDVLRQQLLAGELPLVLSYLFPEIRALRALGKPARQALSEGLIELTDGQGLPHARLLPVLGPLYACWTRARWMGERMNKGPWSRKAELQYQWLVRYALRLVGKGKRFLLTFDDGLQPAWNRQMFTTSLALAGDKVDCAAATAAISRRAVPKRINFDADDLPDASMNSDWSGIAVLASGWSQSDARLAVSYADDPIRIELAARGEQLLAGAWSMKTTSDGAPVTVLGEWERACWESGKRYSYLELSVQLSHNLRLDRQVLFGRQDRVLYLSDILYASDGQPRQLQHSLSLQLVNGTSWQPESETRDGLLVHGRSRAAVMPLSLGEWRADSQRGRLDVEEDQFVLSQQATGHALCCAMFIDLDAKRSKYERTWRQLTVAEWMEVIPHDVAVAYRAQSGDDQWLFYRSIGPVGNRTFMGQNTAGEFSAGPFRESGKYKEWIQIEAV